MLKVHVEDRMVNNTVSGLSVMFKPKASNCQALELKIIRNITCNFNDFYRFICKKKEKKNLRCHPAGIFRLLCVLAGLCHPHTLHLPNQPIQKVLILHWLVYNIWLLRLKLTFIHCTEVQSMFRCQIGQNNLEYRLKPGVNRRFRTK